MSAAIPPEEIERLKQELRELMHEWDWEADYLTWITGIGEIKTLAEALREWEEEKDWLAEATREWQEEKERQEDNPENDTT